MGVFSGVAGVADLEEGLDQRRRELRVVDVIRQAPHLSRLVLLDGGLELLAYLTAKERRRDPTNDGLRFDPAAFEPTPEELEELERLEKLYEDGTLETPAWFDEAVENARRIPQTEQSRRDES